MDTDLPFSLQETCLLYLVGHLDSYSPETLSLLPAHLRHQLLCHLSAFDLQKLENTPVTSGLDVSAYWKALYEYVRRVFDPYCADRYCKDIYCKGRAPSYSYNEQELDYKTDFLLTLVRHLKFIKTGYHARKLTSKPCEKLDKVVDIERCLPCAKFLCLPYQYEIPKQDDHDETSSTCTLKYIQAVFNSLGLNYFVVSLGLVTPFRLNNSFHLWDRDSPECSLSLMKLLMDHFKFQSRISTLHDEIPTFYGSDKKRLNVVERFLSNAAEVELRGTHLKNKKFSKFWKNILTANFLSEKACVSKLFCSADILDWEFEQTFAKSIELLSPLLAYPTSGLSPYKGLEDIEIQSLGDEKRHFRSADHPLCKLATIIDNQDQLKTLYISGRFRDTSECAVLMMAIVRTIEKSSFEYLEIEARYQSEVNVKLFSKVILTYLLSPTSHEQKFKLRINDGCRFSKKKPSSSIKSVGGTLKEESVEGQNKKSLDLDVPNGAVLSMLFSDITSEYNAAELTLKYLECYIYRGFSCLTKLAATDVELGLIWNPIDYRLTRDQILSDKIKRLTVNLPQFGEDRYIPDLCLILSERATSCRSLNSITIIIRDHYSTDTENETIHVSYLLCDTLISLAQVNSLELNLAQFNIHWIEYLTILSKIWKERKPVQKFRKITVPCDIHDDLNSLREICTEVSIEEKNDTNSLQMRQWKYNYNHY